MGESAWFANFIAHSITMDFLSLEQSHQSNTSFNEKLLKL